MAKYDINVIMELIFKLNDNLNISDIDSIIERSLKQFTTENLPNLKLILHVKHNLINRGLSAKVNIKYDNLFKNINLHMNKNMEEYTEIVSLYTLIVTEPKELLKFLIYKVNEQNEKYEEYLKLFIECVKCLTENEIDLKELHSLFHQMIVNKFSNTKVDTWSRSEIIEQSLLLYLELSNNSEILKEIYKIILESEIYSNPDEIYEQCCNLWFFNNLLFMDFDEQYSYNILYEWRFWRVIENGLISDNIKARFIAFNLLKSAVNIVFQEFNEFNVTQLHTEYMVFNENNKQLYSESWQHFILLYKTLLLGKESKNIVTPVLNLFENIQILDAVWKGITYKRLLAHESTAIQRYGIIRILERESTATLNNRSFFKFIGKDLIMALNDMYLYQNDSKNFNEEPKINHHLKHFFYQFIQIEPDFLNLICQIESSKWLAVPFFNICYCLLKTMQFTTNITIPDSFIIETAQNFIDISNKILNIYIRHAVYFVLFDCLQYLYKTNLVNNQFQQTDLESLLVKNNNTLIKLGQFDYLMKKCKIRINSQPWNKLNQWFKLHARNLNEYLVTHEFILKISPRIILLFYDADIITEEQLCLVINSHCSQFTNIGTRSSINITELNKSFKYLIELVDEVRNATRQLKLRIDLISHVSKLKDNFYKFCIRSIESSNEHNVDDINFYIEAFQILLNDKLDLDLLKACLSEIEKYSSNSTVINYFCLAVTNNLIKNIYYTTLIDSISAVLKKFLENFCYSDIKQTNNKLLANFCKVVNDTKIICYTQLKIVHDEYGEDIVSDVFESLDIGGRESISKTMELIQHFLPCILSDVIDDIQRLISQCWNETIELKKSNLFWDAIQQFVRTFVCKELLLCDDSQREVIKYCNEILTQSQQVRGLATIFFEQILVLIKDAEDEKMISLMIPFITKGLLFGYSFRRDERVEYDTIKFIKSLQDVYICNNFESKLELDSVARIRSLEALSIVKEQSVHVDNVLNELLSIYNEVNRPRYFADSNLHRMKNRFFQTMLVIQPYFDTHLNEKVFDFLLRVLIDESPQQSVRYLMEWLFILIIRKQPSLIMQFERSQNEMIEKRISCLTSVIVIMYHLCLLNSQTFFKQAFNFILPLTMSSNFNVRLYAQVTLYWLLEKTRSNTLEHFHIVHKSLSENLNSESRRKQFEQIKQDFFLTIFNPVEHLTIETIFSDLPRLINFIDDSLDLNHFDKSLFKNFHNTNNSLQFYSTINNVTFNNQSDEIIDSVDQQQLNTNIYQKKLIPNIMFDLELNDVEKQNINRTHGELIVVASLIDRVPNMGGLCRTCEIFGVKEYIINNLEHIHHKEFQNLSVSAEKWLKMTEIKQTALKEYLLEMKKNNYTIIGAEQSNNSVQLNDYKFPKKCVLLLGNEKEGIPPNLLGLIDVCVEIPQYGVIRSLNVHVSGALMIWQYALQHFT